MSVLAGEVTPDVLGRRFADSAAGVDSGAEDVRDGLRWLAGSGVLARCAGDLPHTVGVVERIAAECMSSAFSLWAHLMVVEYLRQADPGTDHREVRGELETGRWVGATAMAPALRDVAGL
jgi:hypothetical protein